MQESRAGTTLPILTYLEGENLFIYISTTTSYLQTAFLSNNIIKNQFNVENKFCFTKVQKVAGSFKSSFFVFYFFMTFHM